MNINTSDYKLLIVDDILSNILLLKAILVREKFKIISADSGKKALEMIDSEKPDLVLLDVMMPLMDGYETCQNIRKNYTLEELPVILVTALNNNEDIVKGFSFGANDFVTKPFNNDVLLMRIKFQLSVVRANRLIQSQADELSKTIISRDKLYSIIAHDIRSPLATTMIIMNYVTEKIKDYDNIDSDVVEMLMNVNSISEDAFNLFDNLLKWTKSQTGALKTVLQKIDISSLTISSIDFLSKVAHNKKIDIEVVGADEQVEVYADIDMIKTIYRNLISNAIKFSHEGSKIIVKLENEQDKVVINVIDSGYGISAEDIVKIESGKVDFTKAGTKNESGSGLGLNLTKEFINRNGGELSVISELGKGSTFSFYIPKFREENTVL